MVTAYPGSIGQLRRWLERLALFVYFNKRNDDDGWVRFPGNTSALTRTWECWRLLRSSLPSKRFRGQERGGCGYRGVTEEESSPAPSQGLHSAQGKDPYLAIVRPWLPTDEKPYALDTDACDKDIGTLLSQTPRTLRSLGRVAEDPRLKRFRSCRPTCRPYAIGSEQGRHLDSRACVACR